MKPTSQPEVVELDVSQLETTLQQVEQVMGEETARPFRQLLSWYLSLLSLIEYKNITISRLRRLLFGSGTERSCNLEGNTEAIADSAAEPTDQSPGSVHSNDSDIPVDDG